MNPRVIEGGQGPVPFDIASRMRAIKIHISAEIFYSYKSAPQLRAGAREISREKERERKGTKIEQRAVVKIPRKPRPGCIGNLRN